MARPEIGGLHEQLLASILLMSQLFGNFVIILKLLVVQEYSCPLPRFCLHVPHSLYHFHPIYLYLYIERIYMIRVCVHMYSISHMHTCVPIFFT